MKFGEKSLILFTTFDTYDLTHEKYISRMYNTNQRIKYHWEIKKNMRYKMCKHPTLLSHNDKFQEHVTNWLNKLYEFGDNRR